MISRSSSTLATHRQRVRGLDPWLGRIFLSVGRALYLGPAGDTTPHAHHALQVSVGLSGPVRLRGGTGPWREYDAALVPPDVDHQLDGGSSPVLLVYLEPESEDGRYWLPAMEREIRALDCADAVRECTRALFGDRSEEIDVGDLYSRILRSVGLPATPLEATDPRVLDAIRKLRLARSSPRPLGDLAREVGLSPSRFRHLFREQIGMSTQSYLVWLRLYDACSALARGASLSAAAFEAGFSDGPHFTRTFRRTFGLAPSQVAGRIEFMAPRVTVPFP